MAKVSPPHPHGHWTETAPSASAQEPAPGTEATGLFPCPTTEKVQLKTLHRGKSVASTISAVTSPVVSASPPQHHYYFALE